MSPERVDPGREDWTTKTTPKVLGGITPECTRRAAELYRRAIDTVHEVTSPEAAELTKLLENIFRSVNIALVNELAILCDRMGIDIWEVVDAAATKPFGYMRFSPGPGPRRPLHPDRSLLPQLEGARVRLLHGVHRARRQGQRGDAVLLPLARLAGAQPPRAARDEGLADPRARRRVQAGHRRPARVAGAEAHLAAAERRRRRLVPRPARPARSASRASSCRRRPTSRAPTTASSSSPTTPRSTTRRSWTRRRSSSTSATRPARRAARRSTSSSCERGCASDRLGWATGAATSRATSTTSPTSAGSATRARNGARSSPSATPTRG